jgi:uncharacterized protein (TIGR01319 family)
MSDRVEEMSLILATDVGSTTTKARLFKYTKDSEWRYVISGEAPTTVEAPFEDVTLGVRNAVGEIEELTGLRLLSEDGIMTPRRNGDGVDLYVTTSSAGGGLQMTVAGVISTMTAESAERVALGAGAIVMDTLATDDGRRVFEQIERIRHLRPDMILLAGGTDGGTIKHVMKMAEVISSANPTPRLGRQFELPLVFAGNVNARDPITNFFGDQFALEIVENIRPELEVENPGPARDAIHKCFMEHVMSHAPGYGKLMKWTEVPIMPTPGAEGMMFQQLSRLYKENVLGVGLGGATTNVYSVFDGRFVRTVSANLGMSYSICNVLKETGIGNIVRWIPFKIEPAEVVNRLRNKMTRPTAIPQTLENLLIEHAVAREALRLGFAHHKFLARPLRGVQVRGRDIGDMFKQFSFEETYLDMLRISWLGGTGGLLSHAPRRVQSALMLIDGFQVEGVTKLAQDSVFMMPHLGVLSTVHPEAALEIFEKDCLVRLGTCIAPRGGVDPEREGAVMSVKITMPDGEMEEEMPSGTIKAIPLGEHQTAEVEIRPARGFDVGAGPGHSLMESVEGGVAGIILDTRGRPIHIPEDEDARIEKLIGWFRALDAYPEKMLERQG